MSDPSVTDTSLVAADMKSLAAERGAAQYFPAGAITIENSLMNRAIIRFVLQTTPVLVVSMATRRIVFATPSVESVFGYMEGELIGMSIHSLLPKRFRDAHEAHMEDYSKDPVNRPMGEAGMSLIGLTKKGQEVPVAIALHPFVIEQKVLVAATILVMPNKVST